MLNKYTLTRKSINNKRHYIVGNEHYPSVTTILGATKPYKDRKAIENWKKEIGEKEAEKITVTACNRGTKIHSLIEHKLIGVEKECPSENIGFWESIKPVLSRVSEVQLIEGAVWHPLKFAGSVDCVGCFDGELSIIDWKTASKPKKPEWIEDYFLQVSAYCAGVNRVYGTRISKAVVVIALDNISAQVFKVDTNDLYKYWLQFQTRLTSYHLLNKEKEYANYCYN